MRLIEGEIAWRHDGGAQRLTGGCRDVGGEPTDHRQQSEPQNGKESSIPRTATAHPPRPCSGRAVGKLVVDTVGAVWPSPAAVMYFPHTPGVHHDTRSSAYSSPSSTRGDC